MDQGSKEPVNAKNLDRIWASSLPVVDRVPRGTRVCHGRLAVALILCKTDLRAAADLEILNLCRVFPPILLFVALLPSLGFLPPTFFWPQLSENRLVSFPTLISSCFGPQVRCRRSNHQPHLHPLQAATIRNIPLAECRSATQSPS